MEFKCNIWSTGVDSEVTKGRYNLLTYVGIDCTIKQKVDDSVAKDRKLYRVEKVEAEVERWASCMEESPVIGKGHKIG